MPDINAVVPTHRIGLGLNEGTVGLFGASIFLVGAVLWSAHGPNVEKSDFSLTYVATQIVHQGLGARLYDTSLQKEIQDSLFAHPNPLFFEHPPFEALLLSPLAAFPFRTAYMIWGLLNTAVWLSSVWILRAFISLTRGD